MTLVGAQTQGGQVSLITGPTNFVNGVMMRIVDLVLEGNVKKAKVSNVLCFIANKPVMRGRLNVKKVKTL